MTRKKVVVALGHRALGTTLPEQKTAVKASAKILADLVEAGADIIMLDNMDDETMKEAVKMIDGRAETECSGNVTKERLAAIREIGVDYVSSGALTHSAPIMDISLKNLVPTE